MGEGLTVGARTTYRTLATNSLVAERAPLLPRVLRHVADVQVRNHGASRRQPRQGEPTAEVPLTCLVLGATVTVASVRGMRTLRVDELLHGPYETDLGPRMS